MTETHFQVQVPGHLSDDFTDWCSENGVRVTFHGVSVSDAAVFRTGSATAPDDSRAVLLKCRWTGTVGLQTHADMLEIIRGLRQ